MNKPELTAAQAAMLHAVCQTERGKAAAKRAMAVILAAGGHTVRHVASISDVKPATVRSWLRAWHREGVTGIVTSSRK